MDGWMDWVPESPFFISHVLWEAARFASFLNLQTLTPPFPSQFCLLSLAVHTDTWLRTVQLAFSMFYYALILVCFHSRAQWGKKTNYLESSSEPKKLAILIRSAQSLVLVYINTIHCVPAEESRANIPAAVWLTPQQLWAGRWQTFKGYAIFQFI